MLVAKGNSQLKPSFAIILSQNFSLLLLFSSQIYCWQSLCTSVPDINPCKCGDNSIVCADIWDKGFDLQNISTILDSKPMGNESFADFKLYNTSIERIGDIFKVVSFKHIDISYNQNLTDISDTAFSGSRHTVPIVDALRNDKLGQLGVNQSHIFDMTAQFDKIRYILVSNNAISSVPLHVFHNSVPELSYLNLRENNITRIESKTFDHLLALSDINLGQNGINFIGESAIVLSANITSALIDLDYNQLNSSSFATNWLSLEALSPSAKVDIDLSHNSIDFLDQHVFKDILNANYNVVLTVRYNAFKCDCRCKWLVEGRDVYKSKVRWMTCEDHKDIWDKTVKDFVNCSSNSLSEY